MVGLTNYLITFAHVGSPGSHADISILKRSNLYARIYDYIPFGSGAYMLADQGLQLFSWLLIPFSADQQRHYGALRRLLVRCYNAAVQSSRVVIEQINGILKGRWRILHKGIDADKPHVSSIITACIVLHNVCIMRDDLWPVAEQVPPQETDIGFTPPAWLQDDTWAGVPTDEERAGMEDAGARKMRETIMQQLAPALAARMRGGPMLALPYHHSSAQETE